MIVVSNFTPLIYLAKSNALTLLEKLYKKILIPEAVYIETVEIGKELQIADVTAIEQAIGKWILKKNIFAETNKRYAFLDRNQKLGYGEKEALKLCKQLSADLFIIDDKEGRRTAKILGIEPIGTCGVLIHAYKKKIISTQEAKQIIDSMIQKKFRIETEIYRCILEELEK